MSSEEHVDATLVCGWFASSYISQQRRSPKAAGFLSPATPHKLSRNALNNKKEPKPLITNSNPPDPTLTNPIPGGHSPQPTGPTVLATTGQLQMFCVILMEQSCLSATRSFCTIWSKWFWCYSRLMFQLVTGYVEQHSKPTACWVSYFNKNMCNHWHNHITVIFLNVACM